VFIEGRFVRADSELLEVASRLRLTNAQAAAAALGTILPRTPPPPSPAPEIPRPLSAICTDFFESPFPVESSAPSC